MSEVAIDVRFAEVTDEAALQSIDARTWSPAVTPTPAPPADRPFFDERCRPADVLVAVLDGVVVGYARLGQEVAVPSHEHVLTLTGVAVDPDHTGRGAGRAVVGAAVTEARARGARKLTLRVLGPNATARRLYERCGFLVEGVLQAEFVLDGQDVDDVLMAQSLPADDPGTLDISHMRSLTSRR